MLQIIGSRKEAKFTPLQLVCVLILDMWWTPYTFDEDEGKHKEREKKGKKKERGPWVGAVFMVWYWKELELPGQAAGGGERGLPRRQPQRRQENTEHKIHFSAFHSLLSFSRDQYHLYPH